MAYFPFMVEIDDKNCLVVGGGSIALHKVKKLLPFGVHIKVVGAEICEALWILEREKTEQCAENSQFQAMPKLQMVQRDFRDNDIDGMDFVVAATDDEILNCHISDLCRKEKIPVNAVDMKEACSFIFPAMIQEKDLLIAISTGGQSPAAAAYVKKQVNSHIPDYYGDMIETLGRYRELVLEKVDTAKKRKEVFGKLLQYGDTHDGEIPVEIVHKAICEADGKI